MLGGRISIVLVLFNPCNPVIVGTLWAKCSHTRCASMLLYICRPQQVQPRAAASGSSAAAAGYVIACEEGVVRDVTTRYLTNTLAVKRLRDGSWWASTQQRLEQHTGGFGLLYIHCNDSSSTQVGSAASTHHRLKQNTGGFG